MGPGDLARRMALLQQWMGREIAARQTVLFPDRHWPAPRSIADATVVIDPYNDKLYPSVNTNHVEHLGTSGLASRHILCEIIDLYRASDVSRFFVYLSPSRQAPDVEVWLRQFGMAKVVELSVLSRPVEAIQRPVCPFDIRVCLPAQADDLRKVVGEADDFGYSPGTVDMLGSPSFYSFLATEGGEPAASGSLYVHEGLGYLGNGKTLEPFRNQGAQSALIAARVSLAFALGCTDVVSETYRFLETSYKNLKRAGFAELYSRSIYKWEEPPT